MHDHYFETWNDVPTGRLVRSREFWAIKPSGESVIAVINSTENLMYEGWIVTTGAPYGPFWTVKAPL